MNKHTIIYIHQVHMLSAITKENLFSHWTKCNMSEVQACTPLEKEREREQRSYFYNYASCVDLSMLANI